MYCACVRSRLFACACVVRAFIGARVRTRVSSWQIATRQTNKQIEQADSAHAVRSSASAAAGMLPRVTSTRCLRSIHSHARTSHLSVYSRTHFIICSRSFLDDHVQRFAARPRIAGGVVVLVGVDYPSLAIQPPRQWKDSHITIIATTTCVEVSLAVPVDSDRYCCD